ncbi:LacI family transcriptional regulator [Salipaludibacillus neizhouensis]|uniref:LacI family transcriptional regulator n=1 Tax=Salipaludibacillus neizhouensis TaxID=885475 RepID=A0A3A9K9H4_9BACI|nr:LacI family DNA-binding transcriptional regulator [Salipaludibacillus neizhouensis]RKL67051.1 LacI family transcriptional regulator [Salipaludibacillus neizhouensis]
MKPTIYDVAKEAGVSIATVSKVINNNGRIGESTIKRVLAVMDSLDYQPSGVAAALAGKKTFTIGVLVPDISNSFFSEMAKLLENNAREAGYALIICSTYYQIDREQMYLDLLIKKEVDGIIIATDPLNIEAFNKVKVRQIPVVLFTIDEMSFSTHVVTTDDFRGGYLAGRYLMENGHRKITVILEEGRKNSITRLKGFKEAIGEQNVTLSENQLYTSKSSILEAREIARSLLASEEIPTAVFCFTDLIAMVLIKEARILGISVPEELSVVGYDNTLLAELCDPELTTVAQPIKELAKHTIDQIVHSISYPEGEWKRIVLMPELKEGKSVKIIKEVKID